MRGVDQYLARYATAEAAAADRIDGVYTAAVVIPAYDEDGGVERAVARAAAACAGRVVCIVVVNATDDAPARAHARNAALLAALSASRPRWRALDGGGAIRLGHGAGPTDLVVVDRAGPGRRLGRRGGVGLARRIGFDLALRLWRRGGLASAWIHTTDADAALPADAFEVAAAAPPQAVALTYPFWHELDETTTLGRALAIYELSLRYYVLGLAWAGSPYAFHTVGSTLAVSAPAYAAVRGVPCRRGGEDFHLLRKLAKVGPVLRPRGGAVQIFARPSDRVPFGTGPAARNIAAMIATGEPPRLFHPASFAALKSWLAAAAEFSATRDPAALAGAPDRADAVHPGAGDALAHAARTLRLREGLAAAAIATTSAGALARRIAGWFDALRTLQLIHAVRDAGLAPMPWHQALAEAPFLALPAGADLRRTRRALLSLEAERLGDRGTPRRE